VLETNAPFETSDIHRIGIQEGSLDFVAGKTDVIAGFGITIPDTQSALDEARKQGLPVSGQTVTICGTQFALS
jgi:hypothetical protein